MERSLRVLDGCVTVLCAKGGVEPQSETVWRQADHYNVPRIIYVNKMDIMGADFYNVIDMVHDRLKANAVPIQLPIGKEADFRGIIDLVEMKADIYYDDLGKDMRVEEIPADMLEQAKEYRNQMLEAVSDFDDEIMEMYLEGEEVAFGQDPRRHPHAPLSRSRWCPSSAAPLTRTRACRSCSTPSSTICPARSTSRLSRASTPRPARPRSARPSDDAPFSALAFKIMTDPYVGKLAFFRVYSGTVNAGDTVINATKGQRERMGRILLMHANHREDLQTAYSGDIAAAVGLKNTTTGDTLCDDKHQIVLENMEFPEPVIRVAIEPKTKAGQEKMSIALAKLAEEDPTFKTYTDEETGQTIIAGMGELHLEIIVDRLLREFKVEANVGKPQVSYKETITKPATVDTRFVRQTGGRGQFAHVKLTIEPNESGKGYEFVDDIHGGAIPKEYIPCVDQGIQGAMQAGILGGYQVVDVKATLIDGSFHEVDSSENAFRICGSMAFKEAMAKAGPTLLEPIMKVSVTAPEDYMGTVVGDLNARRGQVVGTDIRNGAVIVTANVPLSTMFGYATDLRSKTQGRANYSMEPSHFVELPKSLQEKIIGNRG